MKRIAILTTNGAPVAGEMSRMLNEGSRYRVGTVPQEIAMGDYPALLAALEREKIDLVIVENYEKPLPGDFPYKVLEIGTGEDALTATRRLMEVCPDYKVERQWAETLGESFDEKRANPGIPTPDQAQPVPADEAHEPEAAEAAPAGSQPQQPAAQGVYLHPMLQNPGQNVQERRPQMPSTYLLWSILATVFCCMAAGIVAIIFSAQVSSKYFAGDYEGARKASRMAEIWIIVSIVGGVITNTLYLPLMLAGIG